MKGYLTDVALLDLLVGEKLEAEAKKLRAEGWKWIEIMPEIDRARVNAMNSVEPEDLPIDEERREESDRLAAEYDALIEEHGENPPDEIAAQLETLSERIDELSTPEPRWTAEDMARAGVVVGIDRGGRLAMVRGPVRPEDETEADRDGPGESAEPGTSHPTPKQ